MESDEIPQSESSRARDFIAELGGKNGFVEQKYWDELSEAGRAKFRRAISSLQGELEPAIKALAQSLYSSTGRFVFELLQNAEDCDFYHAKRRNESPYISFHLSKDQLVIECNEDGFSKADLEAICSIGKSSKSATKGYIGEKGIGFKSVFMAAWKVHIQSGPYSFYFKHHPSDGGMGMITPIWQEPTEELPRHMTRMTLDLHTEGDPQAILAQRDSFFHQLRMLKGNALLFMNKLEEIRIGAEENGTRASIVISKSQVDDHRIKILSTATDDDIDGPKSSSTLYHITKHQVHNLSKNENRTYTEEEDRRKEYSTSEIVLAFPLTPKYAPIIESQEVFAFLPVQPAGFPFLIQGDFMTNASREHIVTTAARNTGLRDGIPEAFIKAALEFCNHDTLQYTWMQFIPVKEKMVDTDFWSVLVTNIETKVRETPLIRPDSGGRLRLITSLRNPRPIFVDEESNLLLRDLTPELSISRRYGSSSLAILENLGLVNFYGEDIIRMIDQDLQSPDSWLKSGAADSYLQVEIACLLSIGYKDAPSRAVRSMIEKLPIIPLQDGRWLAATSDEKVFFPDTSGLTVPEDLEFNLVLRSAAAQPSRRGLFETLGVESLSVGSVRERIVQRQVSYWKSPGKRVEFYVQQLKFLYSTHDRETHHLDDYGNVLLIDDGVIQRRTTSHDVYLPDDDPLGPRELLKPIVCDDSSIKGAPGFKVDFLHDSYLQNIPEPLQEDSLTWKDWLVEVMSVRRKLRLANNVSLPTDLSQVCHYVAKHRPEKFVAFLVHHWSWKKTLITKGNLILVLGETKVLCQGGRMLDLRGTYLPFSDLQSQCTRFLAGKAAFPFLQFESPIERKDYNQDWGFMNIWLGVGDAENLFFYLDILKAFSTVKHPTKDDSHRVFELYSVIHGCWLQSKDFEKKHLKNRLNGCSMVLVPSEDGRESVWAPLADCLWEAPPCLTTSHPLKARMQHFLTEFTSLPSFFVDILGVPNCDFSHIMRELEHLSDNESLEVEAITSLYQQLGIMVQSLPAVEQNNIKWAFASRKLIYAEKEGCGGWHKVAYCLWASEWDLPTWAILKPHYKGLYDFFVNFLGVRTLSLELVYNELDDLGSSSDATRDQIEPNIWLLNSYLSTESRSLDPKMLLHRRIFPVRYPDGHVQLEMATVEFAIVDREQLGDIFKPRAKTLDFDLDQVRMLEPTLNWLGLRERYLSEVVREVSRVQGASKESLSTPERSFKPRAHALYRIAYHYNSPRLEEWGSDVYNSFETAEVYETDGIAATLSLNQDGREICYEKGLSDLHIEVDDIYLEIFVPRDKKSQESCYARKLPLGIFKWLMTPSDGGQVTMNEKALRLIASVLNSSRSVIEDILEEEGIAAGEFEDGYEEVEELEEAHDAEKTRTTSESHVSEDSHNVEEFHDAEDVASSSDEDPIATPSLATTEAEETPSLAAPDSSQPAASARQETVDTPPLAPSIINQGVATSSPARRQPTRSRRFSSSDIAKDVSYLVARSDFATTRNQSTIQPMPAVPTLIDQETTRYQALLERVVTSARRSPRLPSQGAYDMTGMSHALSDLMDDSSDSEVDQFPRFRSSSQQERDRKIGAAGELYVFELLKNLTPGLPGFSLENWRSTIRRYVSAHPDYANICHWNHRETSDFEYDDSEGALTELMIDNGYLERDIWGNKKPRYYLEVKTTTGPCEAPFYMSKSQYRLMHQCQDTTDKIYVVFRVYEVEKAAVQLRVYVNPAGLKDSGRLLYTAETWSVRPGIGA